MERSTGKQQTEQPIVRGVFFLALIALGLLVPGVARAQGPADGYRPIDNSKIPKELKDVGVDEKLGAEIPMNLPFVDGRGNVVTLKSFFPGDRPVILTLNYSNCPGMCSIQLSQLCQTLTKIKPTPGVDFNIVSISLDPKESPERALATQKRYVEEYGRPVSPGGFEFLVGSQKSIETLTKLVGFKYNYLPDVDQYVHPAAAIFCTPDGRVARYLTGVYYEPGEFETALKETNEGKLTASLTQFIASCFVYDANKGSVGFRAMQFMKVGGLVTACGLLTWLTAVWRRSVRAGRQTAAGSDRSAVSPG